MPIVSGKYQNPGWRNGQAPAINATELNAISDTLEKLGARQIIVGTSTEGHTLAECDFLCDGTSDDVEINAALSLARTLGASVLVLEGTYNITDTISAISVSLSGVPENPPTFHRVSTSFNELIAASDLSYINTEGEIGFSQNNSCIEVYMGPNARITDVHISFPPGYAIHSYAFQDAGTVSCILERVSVFPWSNNEDAPVYIKGTSSQTGLGARICECD